MLSPSGLEEILADLPLVEVTGPWTRTVGHHLLQGPPPGAPPGSPPQPLWAGGPELTGGRFTPKGSFESIYLASDPVTALKEVSAIFEGPYTLRTPPWTLFAVEGRLGSILDLTDLEVLERLGTSTDELTGDWRYAQAVHLKGKGPLPSTQLLGREAHESGKILGLRYPSAKNPGKGTALVVFPDRLRPDTGSFLRVYDPHRRLAQRIP